MTEEAANAAEETTSAAEETTAPKTLPTDPTDEPTQNQNSSILPWIAAAIIAVVALGALALYLCKKK